MEKILKKFTYTLMAVSIMFIFLISFLCGGVGVTYAATSTSEVLADLRKDPDFDESAYPYVKDDYGLHVIQVAESSNKELFVYAYQPCHDTYDLKGTKISISYGYSLNGTDLSPKLYNLRLVSTSGTLDKYYVEGFTVPNDGDRYYNIVEIFRMINTEIDGEQDETNPKTDIACPVGQQWYVCDLNDSKHYEMSTFNTMSVETVCGGSTVFNHGVQWGNLAGNFDYCNAWYFCFTSDDYIIDHIYEADLNYRVRKCRSGTGPGLSGETEYLDGDGERINFHLTDSQMMSFDGAGFLGDKFEWHRILNSKDFVETVESQDGLVPDDVKSKILTYDNDNKVVKNNVWVFTYLETERSVSYLGNGTTISYFSIVDEVGVLTLSFQDISGGYYDLGVVNDLTDPDDKPDILGGNGLKVAIEDFWEIFKKVIFIILGILALALLLNFVTPVMGILKFIFKGIIFVISLPFKLLKSIFKKE